MKSVKVYDYIYLGTSIWYLQTIPSGNHLSGIGYTKNNFDILVRHLNSYGLSVSARASDQLGQYLKSISDEVIDNELSSDHAKEIRRHADLLRSTIDAESKGLFAYLVINGRYDSEKLLSNPFSFFRDLISSHLPDIALSDIEESTKCLAYQRPTAAAFHMMRATEAALKSYYCFKVKRDRCQMMWGPMITHLRKKPKPDIVLLDHLDAIRRNFRNPTQHPDKVYDMNEAQDLFGVCIDVLNRVAAVLPMKEA